MGTRSIHRGAILLALLLPGCVFDTGGLRPSSRDGARPEVASGEASTGESTLDQAADHPRPGDVGCPPGLTACGGVCVDLLSNPDHCSGCDKPCAAGLDCVAGSCECVASGRCTGCCEGKLCRAPTTTAACGKGGAVCKSCDDQNPCTADSCPAGSCVHAPISAAFCDDKLFCTVADGCAVGLCIGWPRDCPDDACNNGVCDEASDQCKKEPKPNGTKCGQPHKVCVNGKCIDPED